MIQNDMTIYLRLSHKGLMLMLFSQREENAGLKYDFTKEITDHSLCLVDKESTRPYSIVFLYICITFHNSAKEKTS